MFPYSQCTVARPKADVTFRSGGKGRAITLKAGEYLWVQNSLISQKKNGYVMLGRKRHKMGEGYCFLPAQCAELFNFEPE